MTTLIKSVGVAVRQSREAYGWSQERLAEYSDLNRSYVGEVERGHAIASLQTVEKLARSLGITPSTLVMRGEVLSQANLVRGLQLAAIAC